MSGLRVLVCGGRSFSDGALLHETLQRYDIALLIHGAAEGADWLAGLWGEMAGVPALPFPADWKRYGPSAGPIRNALMLSEGRPDLVIAFPGGRGTADMVAKARRAGVEVADLRGANRSGPLE